MSGHTKWSEIKRKKGVKPVVYIAGPMTGYPEFNYPAFNAAEVDWKSLGYAVLNPVINADGDTTQEYKFYIRKSIEQVLQAGAIAVLPGWQKSPGASVEVDIARLLGYPIYDAITHELWNETPLQEAQRIVHGARQAAYGHPLNNFGMTGRMWGAILGIGDIAPETVGLMQVALKISREVNYPQRDNRVDIAGYSEAVQLIHEKRAEDGV